MEKYFWVKVLHLSPSSLGGSFKVHTRALFSPRETAAMKYSASGSPLCKRLWPDEKKDERGMDEMHCALRVCVSAIMETNRVLLLLLVRPLMCGVQSAQTAATTTNSSSNCTYAQRQHISWK